ncbi:protein translocase subunit secG [Thiocapsa rosea]|uniref:Protein-export membrane protein SecG n=1 Tax=Thiocapsa rosea TaxID=69360 RepID=A0A495V0E4_9GAMM|nr:preprotein translocase subunit SecG [Thiocapsa rosea]RKT42719.1 protein translocase subunit secG [Thiocapsa rosea]
MQTILTVMQVFLSLGLIGLILIQHGKGADAGAAFGSGASATVFGSRGSGSFLTRTTGIMATMFFLTSMALAYYATKGSEPVTIMDRVDERTIVVPPPAAAPTSDIPAIPGVEAEGRSDVQSDVPVGLAPEGEAPGGAIVEEEVVEESADGTIEAQTTEVILDGSPVEEQNEGDAGDSAAPSKE